MGPAPLPGGAVQHRRHRVLEALVGVGDHQLDPGQAASDQRAQKRRPGGAVLGRTDIQAQHLPMAIGIDSGGNQCGGVGDPTTLADLDHQGVQPHKGIRAGVQRPVAPRGNDLIELGAHPGDLRLADPIQPHRAGDVVDPPGRHTLHITLSHHRGQRPLGPPTWFQDRRQIAALAHPGDRQLDRAGPGVPVPEPVAVTVRHPTQGPLAVFGPDLGRHLRLHQRLGQHANSLAQEVDVAALGLANKLQQLHLGHGHHVAPLDVLIEPFTSRTYAVATLIFSLSGLLLHHSLGRYCIGGAPGRSTCHSACHSTRRYRT
jgi:hypothetical protein